MIALDPVRGMSREAWPVRFPEIPPLAVIGPVTANPDEFGIDTPSALTVT